MFNYLTCNHSIIIALAFSTQIALSTKVAAADPLRSDVAPAELAAPSGRAFEHIAAPTEFANRSKQAFENIQEPFSDISTLFEQAPCQAIPLENLVAEEDPKANEVVQATPESDEVIPDMPKDADLPGIEPPRVLSAPTDPENQIREIRQRSQERDAEQAPCLAIALEYLIVEEDPEAMVTASHAPTTWQDTAPSTNVTSLLEASTRASDLLPVPEQSATQLDSLENFEAINLRVQKSLEVWQYEPDSLEFSEFDATTAPSFLETPMAQVTDDNTTLTTDDNEVVQTTPESDEVTPDIPKQTDRFSVKPPSGLSGPTDPENQIREIRQRSQERDALIPVSPLGGIRDVTDKLTDDIYDAVKLELGLSFHHTFQWLTDALPNSERSAATTDMDFIGNWALLNAEKPSQGQLVSHLEGRWDYGTIGPQNLGFVSLGNFIGTANSFSGYDPTFLVRNLYWAQGSRQAGWYYRIGKITPDAILGTSRYLNPNTTFLPNGGNGFFSNAFPDSGLGIVGVVAINERFSMLALVSDANADRFNFGDIGKGQFYTAVEFIGKIAPQTENSGSSKLTLWHHPGGKAINASTGVEGWGFTLKLEQELTSDGRLVGIVRWGRSFDNSAIYKQQVGVHLVLNEPRLFNRIKNDAVGLAFNWIQPADVFSGRDEYDLEVFYRVPLFPLVDTTFHFQQVFSPAFAPEINNASVFSVRLTTSF